MGYTDGSFVNQGLSRYRMTGTYGALPELRAETNGSSMQLWGISRVGRCARAHLSGITGWLRHLLGVLGFVGKRGVWALPPFWTPGVEWGYDIIPVSGTKVILTITTPARYPSTLFLVATMKRAPPLVACRLYFIRQTVWQLVCDPQSYQRHVTARWTVNSSRTLRQPHSPGLAHPYPDAPGIPTQTRRSGGVPREG